MNERPKKVISGDYRYCRRVASGWFALGWHLVKAKKWSDGKWTIVLEERD